MKKLFATLIIVASTHHCYAMIPLAQGAPVIPTLVTQRTFDKACDAVPYKAINSKWGVIIQDGKLSQDDKLERVQGYFDSWLSHADLFKRRTKVAHALKLAAQQPNAGRSNDKIVEYLLGDVNPDFIDPRCLIKLAATNGHANLMKYIMQTYEGGKELATRQLHQALLHGNSDGVRTALRAGVDPMNGDFTMGANALDFAIAAFQGQDAQYLELDSITNAAAKLWGRDILYNKLYNLRIVIAHMPVDKRPDRLTPFKRCDLPEKLRKRVATALYRHDMPKRLCMDDGEADLEEDQAAQEPVDDPSSYTDVDFDSGTAPIMDFDVPEIYQPEPEKGWLAKMASFVRCPNIDNCCSLQMVGYAASVVPWALIGCCLLRDPKKQKRE